MKTINRYINERLVLNKHSKLTNDKLKEIVDLIINVLCIDEYTNRNKNGDTLDDIIKGIKEGVLLAEITEPYFLTCRSYYDEISNYGTDVERITPISDNNYNKICQKINYKNAERVFKSNKNYGLNIYVNEYGINFVFYQYSIFVIDQNSKIIDDIDK